MVRLDPITLTSRSHPLFIYLAGCDGTGKSVQSKVLRETLQRTGVVADSLWLRSPFFFSVPFLIYARLRKLNWVETVGGGRQTYWDFSASWLLREVFPYVYWFDALLASFFRVKLPRLFGRSYVCERFVLDMVVDLSVALRNIDFFASRPGQMLIKLIPQDAAVFILDSDVTMVCMRRPQLVYDRSLLMRLQTYRTIAAALGYRLVSTDESVRIVVERILCEAIRS
jgi:hypothetical protein